VRHVEHARHEHRGPGLAGTRTDDGHDQVVTRARRRDVDQPQQFGVLAGVAFLGLPCLVPRRYQTAVVELDAVVAAHPDGCGPGAPAGGHPGEHHDRVLQALGAVDRRDANGVVLTVVGLVEAGARRAACQGGDVGEVVVEPDPAGLLPGSGVGQQHVQAVGLERASRDQGEHLG
jgi:hypothetical protein